MDQDIKKYGAITQKTRDYAKTAHDFNHIRIKNGQLEARGNFSKDVLKHPEFRKGVTDLQIVDYLTDELDRHTANYLVDVRLGAGGVEVHGVTGIDNDGGFSAINYRQNSIRAIPRVMSRRQIDQIKALYENRNKPNGILSQLKGVVKDCPVNEQSSDHRNPSNMHDNGNHRGYTAHVFKPNTYLQADQVKKFELRLGYLYDVAMQSDRYLTKNGKPLIDNVDRRPVIKIIKDNDENSGWAEDEIAKQLNSTASNYRLAS